MSWAGGGGESGEGGRVRKKRYQTQDYKLLKTQQTPQSEINKRKWPTEHMNSSSVVTGGEWFHSQAHLFIIFRLEKLTDNVDILQKGEPI